MIKRNKITIIVGIIILLVIAGLYGTFAVSTKVEDANNNYILTLSESVNEITIPANGSKTIIYKLKNLNDGTVSYGVGYSGTNINVKVYSDSYDTANGFVDNQEYKYIKLIIENTGDSSSVATIVSVLGYENGGQLIKPQGITLVTQTYTPLVPELIGVKTPYFMESIFVDSGETVTETNASNPLRVDLDNQIVEDPDGNLRYYGTGIDSSHNADTDYHEPNNYIYFNCDNYSNQSDSTCEKWRIIGKVDGMLKIMRGSSIGKYSFDSSSSGQGSNAWTQADIMTELNTFYYNGESGTCYNGQYNASTTCDFSSSGTVRGLKNNDTRNMIAGGGVYGERNEDAQTYYLKGSGVPSSSPYETFTMERTDGTVISDDNEKWQGNIALVYASDYGYATDLSKCNILPIMFANSDNNYACRRNNWMWYVVKANNTSSYTTSYSWLMTPGTGNNYDVWYINSSGVVYGRAAYNSSDIIPVVSLSSRVRIDTNHAGDTYDPYTLVVAN